MKRALIVIGVSLSLSLVVGVAPVAAHQRIEPTHVTINASATQVDDGQKVTFKGKLKSDWKKCRSWRLVKLKNAGGKLVKSKKTRENGRYKFSMRPDATKGWKVVFSGRKWGTHPHVHRCLGSSSRTIRVRVN